MNFLGLGKTKYFSSLCFIPNGEREQMQVWQTERLSRKKNSGAWPHLALKSFLQSHSAEELVIAENRDVETPLFFEQFLNEEFPFYDFLKKEKLDPFSSFYNKNIHYVGHHQAHAYAALLMSPFEKSVILVLDGAGSRARDLKSLGAGISPEALEECSIFLQDGATLREVYKRWIHHQRDTGHRIVSEGIGNAYESTSQFIFKDANSSGKVMGLAPLGKPLELTSVNEFFLAIPWERSFQGQSKKEWEESPDRELYQNLAATVQRIFEAEYDSLIKKIRTEYPEYRHLILTGGCALNCTNNARLFYQKFFDSIYVLPFPGDDGIAVGCAAKELYTRHPEKWKPLPSADQKSYWGPLSSIPDEQRLIQLLQQKNIAFELCEDVAHTACEDLVKGRIVAWFQGRSESGPRALGNRSILVRPDLPGAKNLLNSTVKRREQFRPYGCTVLQEKAALYFEMGPGLDNSFMSFAVKIKEAYKNILREVAHIDGTSRMQTLQKSQNALFYDLIERFGENSGLYCVLNTSLNIMGEPIVETMEDGIRFFEKTPVDVMYIGKIKLKRA